MATGRSLLVCPFCFRVPELSPFCIIPIGSSDMPPRIYIWVARVLLCGFLYLWLLSAAAQAQYHFDHWTTDNGLPQNTVRDMVQTRDGYIWIATLGGLARFDGKRFTVFSKVTQPEMRSNRLTVLHEDRKGQLWIGTEEGGLLRYHEGVFTSWTTREGLPGNFIDYLDEDEAGTLLIFTDQGAAQWRDGRFTSLPLIFQPILQSNPMMLYARYLNFALKPAATGHQIFHQGRWEDLPPALSDGQNGSKVPFGNILPGHIADSRGRLWFNGTTTSGYYAHQGSQWKAITAPPTKGAPFYLDQKGRYWTIYQTGVALEKDGYTVPLPVQGVSWWYRVLEDREGNVWLGTYENGLLRLLEQTVSFLTLPGEPRERYVYPLLESRSGKVWISAGEAGLTQYADGQFKRFPLPGAKGSLDISSFYEDRDGSLLVGTYLYGLTRFQQGQWRKDEALSAHVKGRVDVIFRDRQGDLWLGGQNGLDRQASNGQWTHYGPENGLPTKHVKTMLEDSAGRLWIAGYGCLALWDKGHFTTWTPAEGLIADRVIALHEDSEQRLWVGTAESGLYRFQPTGAGWQMTRYTTREGLFSNEVKQIFEDEQGYFWIGSEQGIYRLRKQELNDFAAGRSAGLTCVAFGKADGLLNTACIGGFQPAGFKARDGRLWFPTMEGVAIVDPRRVSTNPLPPPIAIEDCLLDRRHVDWQAGISIQPGQSSLEINYTGLSFHKSDQMRFRYRLEGLEDDWIEAGPRRTAYYSHLPAGSYMFRVTAANSDGIWNNAGKSLRIVVVPPLYRRWWFVLLALTTVIGLVALAFQYRIQQLQTLQQAQQSFARQLIASQEAERKRIAAELHDGLSQSLVIIKNRALMGLRAPVSLERATAQLEEIADSSVSAIDEVREIAYALRPFHLDRLGLTKAIVEMAEKVGEAHHLQTDSNLTPLEGLWSPETEINLYRIVQESLNNVVKHAQATKCRITALRHGPTVTLEIADNGRGFVTAEREPRTVKGETGKLLLKKQNPKSGFGLLGMAERVRLLGGQWQIQATPGAGTTITITLRVPETKTPSTEDLKTENQNHER